MFIILNFYSLLILILGFAWELEKTLDVVMPPPAEGQRPHTAESDADDVVTALR